MKKSSMIVLTLSFIVGIISPSDAIPLRISVPGIEFTAQQPVQVIVYDSYGNAYESTAYYDSSIGGIDIDTAWAGPNASIYLPMFNTGYLWFNGFWVDREGYYWDHGRRLYLNSPRWNDHWSGYWRTHTRDRRDRWDRKDWHDRDRKEWRHDGRHEGYRHKNEHWRHEKSEHDGRKDADRGEKRNMQPENGHREEQGKYYDKSAEKMPHNESRHGSEKH